jgi:hypothetical protein
MTRYLAGPLYLQTTLRKGFHGPSEYKVVGEGGTIKAEDIPLHSNPETDRLPGYQVFISIKIFFLGIITIKSILFIMSWVGGSFLCLR